MLIRVGVLALMGTAVAVGLGVAARRGSRWLLPLQVLAMLLMVEAAALWMVGPGGLDALESTVAGREDPIEIPTTPPLWGFPSLVDSLRTPRAPGQSRVVFMGDSFTHGQGVLEQERFSHVVAERFPEVTELNLANPGLSLADEITLYGDLYWTLSADVVVWTFTLNDLGAKAGPKGRDDFVVDRRDESGSWLRSWYWLKRVWTSRAETLATEEAYAAALADPAALDALETRLRPLVEEVTGRGGRFVFVVFPLLHKLSAYPFEPSHRSVAERASAAGAEVVDLLPVFQGMDSSALWASRQDHHPNARAHRMAGEAIVQAIGEVPSSAPARCEAPPALSMDAERDLLRRMLCEDPGSVYAWLDWAEFMVDGPTEAVLRPVSPRRYVRRGVLGAWRAAEPSQQEQVRSRGSVALQAVAER